MMKEIFHRILNTEMNKAYILTFCLCVISFLTKAQDPKQWEGEGELKPIEVIITKERELTLPSANRNFDKVPPRPVEATRPPFTYDFRAFNFQAPQVTLPVKPLKLKAQSKPTLYGGYLRAGYG